jgi:hypothetical protein
MMAQAKELLALLQVGTPLYYAVLVFWIFGFLDRRASSKANKAISDWLRTERYVQADVAAALVEVFDRIYTSPLWGWQAICRSTVISVVVTFLAIYHVYPMTFYILRTVPPEMKQQFLQQIVTNFVADYLALYVIRAWLKSGMYPLLALVCGPLIGIALVFALYTTGDVVRFSVQTETFHPRYLPEGLSFWIARLRILWLWALDLTGPTVTLAIFVGGIAVHAWLLVVAKALNSARRATVGMQWFLKEGNQHPLRALGYVAAPVTFLVAAVLQYS